MCCNGYSSSSGGGGGIPFNLLTTTSQNVRLARQVKVTDHFKVPGLAWKWMHYDATNDLAFCQLCVYDGC